MDIELESKRILAGRELSFEPDRAFLTRVKAQSYTYNLRISEGNKEIIIYYISDIHLEYHLYKKTLTLDEIINSLFSNELRDDIAGNLNYVILFGGDTSSSVWINEQFMSRFMCKYKELGGMNNRVVTVIGNHEYFGFSDIEICINTYFKLYESLGVVLLNNNSHSINFESASIVVIGGIGFSGYNEIEFNARNGTYKTLTRADEKIRTVLWEKRYFDLISYNRGEAVYVCLTHYPIYDWRLSAYPGISYSISQEKLLDRVKSLIDPNILYISGHTHTNIRYNNYFADNQNGYYNKGIRFKRIVIR